MDWNRQIAHVVPTDVKGRLRWTGSSMSLSRDLCQSVRRLSGSNNVSGRWSNRTRAKVAELRAKLASVCGGGTGIVNTEAAGQGWTFTGLRTNATLGALLQDALVVSAGVKMLESGRFENAAAAAAGGLWLHGGAGQQKATTATRTLPDADNQPGRRP